MNEDTKKIVENRQIQTRPTSNKTLLFLSVLYFANKGGDFARFAVRAGHNGLAICIDMP